MKDQIAEFVARLTTEAAADPFFANMTDAARVKNYTVTFGKKYARVLNEGSAWGFIDMATGDIYKAASWKAPAKHARGNIETAKYGRNYTWTGPAYLR